MASAEEKQNAEAKKRLKGERQQLAKDQKAQKKAAKARAKEIAAQEAQLDEEGEGGGFSTVAVTTIIVLVWLAILCFLIKMDVGGFASGVLTPILKDVPVVNMILPSGSATSSDGTVIDSAEATDRIKELEKELESAQSQANAYKEENAVLKAEVERLSEFEDQQLDFERVRLLFYEEVVYADNGPGVEEYQKYYEAMDPTTAEYLYKQVVQQIEASAEVQEYALAYSSMKPKNAAAIFEEMTDNLDLAAKILGVMDAGDRGDILGAMDPEVAAKITKIMDPN